MLPAHLAENVKKQVLFYLQSTFSFRDSRVERAFERYLLDPEQGMFKGPWLTLRRPFTAAPEGAQLPFDLKPPFHPFRHQYRAWRRLSSRGKEPESTLVTTGTGSGKTECFLYPILDHCLRMRADGQKGIKAIILYPMNALASDQEQRFAEEIWKNPSLKGSGIRVGTYTGQYDPGRSADPKQAGTDAMGEKHGITNHEVQKENPPDILLTNYKMLDYLFIRPDDQGIWQHNAPGVLRYLVLDELHTYDGAQGADVALLIRRLKEKLAPEEGQLCVVGTSATLDNQAARADGDEGPMADVQVIGEDRLARFAGTLFEATFPLESVIGEDRQPVSEIVREPKVDLELPDAAECRPGATEDSLMYALRQASVWGAPEDTLAGDADEETRAEVARRWGVELGAWLRRTSLFRELLEIFAEAEQQGRDPLAWEPVLAGLRKANDPTEKRSPEEWELILLSFLALMAHALELRSGRTVPLIPTQVQLWIRELRRLGRIVDEAPAFVQLEEAPEDRRCLPAFHCSECGESGWIGLHETKQDAIVQKDGVVGIQLLDSPAAIYPAWFASNQQVVIVSPWGEDTPAEATEPTLDIVHEYMCPQSLVIRQGAGPCPLTEDPRHFRVRVSRETVTRENGKVYSRKACPRCDSVVGIFFIGSQAATLSSVAIDEMFGSILNRDPKLLAFTDSVQDASHRAGFFTARTYHFTLRTALQHVIDVAAEDGVPLPEVGANLLSYWREPLPGRPGSVKEAMGAVMPPDLQEYGLWRSYRESGDPERPPVSLREAVEQRLTWQATSEFGLMQTHGRTMELAAGAALGWDVEKVSATVEAIRGRLPGIDPALEAVTDEQLRRWLLGLMHRYRVRGALDHPYLKAYAIQNFWGKYPFGKVIPGRETYPAAGHYKPHLLVTQSKKGHEHVLAQTRGNKSPWHIVWTRRALARPQTPETTILDLMQAFLHEGNEHGLLKKLHQDGACSFYALAATAARLFADTCYLACTQSGQALIRPANEAAIWRQAPSMDYSSDLGQYVPMALTPRQQYYQERYRRGALRRVVAYEHTGLLQTQERLDLEEDFKDSLHADDPNVLTCTSTLEMGIDIGDLSSTMLCAIPPTTSSYLQRIGRAGRATGTALIISIINQKPHDLFFYARPNEMLKGQINPPGCWLDASAVLARQYLAFCLDCASGEGIISRLPQRGRDLVEDLNAPEGVFMALFDWMTRQSDRLRGRFLARLRDTVQDDTRSRFMSETETELIWNRVDQAARAFDGKRRALINTQRQLNEDLRQLPEDAEEERTEIKREQKILRGRLQALDRTQVLEILTDAGLLPNYSFPEHGVRFYGSIYNRHGDDEQTLPAIDLARPARSALRDLAPWATFYTHRRQFEIQQIAVGNREQSLAREWIICGNCGHLRDANILKLPEAQPACPQCGHLEGAGSPLDIGQRRLLINFAESEAISYMEHYDSLSGDRSDERQNQIFQVIRSFDHTEEGPSGAVGEDSLPFGIEYRSALTLREINVGYWGQPGSVAFGPDAKQKAPEDGFLACADCGIVVKPDETADKAHHRRSCRGHREYRRWQQQGKAGTPVRWLPVYLYRELRSEAIRLLLPEIDAENLDTLIACLYLGLRLRFEGDPGYLAIHPQVMPDPNSGVTKYYLVIMDSVPGGTGYLKTLYQEHDAAGRAGEGIVNVLKLALATLEHCRCRQMSPEDDLRGTDGCYRCIRSFHLQHRSANISAQRGIQLLKKLVAAAEKRQPRQALDDIKPDSLFGSYLEKRVVEALESFVTQDCHGMWEETIVKGAKGFRFRLPGEARIWDLQLQPLLGVAQGVMIQSQPDFLLTCDDEHIRPIAIFADGFDYHCQPPNNRLADDMQKRRAILESANYRVWGITWDDIEGANETMICTPTLLKLISRTAPPRMNTQERERFAAEIAGNGLHQLFAFIRRPDAALWKNVADFMIVWPITQLLTKQTVLPGDLQAALNVWRQGDLLPELSHAEQGAIVFNKKVTLTEDFIAHMQVDEVIVNQKASARLLGRLPDDDPTVSESSFKLRWRRFLACLNCLQFSEQLLFWATSEVNAETAPVPTLETTGKLTAEWEAVLEETLPSLRSIAYSLAQAGAPAPQIEYDEAEGLPEGAFAEMAWPELTPPVVLLAGDQESFATAWQKLKWSVIVTDDLQARGIAWLIEQVT